MVGHQPPVGIDRSSDRAEPIQRRRLEQGGSIHGVSLRFISRVPLDHGCSARVNRSASRRPVAAAGLSSDRDQLWGGVALFRGSDDRPFDDEEVHFVGSLSSALGQGVRAGLLASLAASAPTESPTGPAVVIVGADGQVLQINIGAERWLAELEQGVTGGAPAGIVSALVGAARRYARGQTATAPRARIRTRSGMWLVLHATPLSARDGSIGEVVVTIEEARPPEIVPLVVAAFGLTARERDVTTMVLQGLDTKEIGRGLHLSAWTVQDHLKSIFEKASVRSRRELIARIYFDQYVPRLGAQVGPSGWFVA